MRNDGIPAQKIAAVAISSLSVGLGFFAIWWFVVPKAPSVQGSSSQGTSMKVEVQNKQAVCDMVEAVWTGRDLSALPKFWTDDCLNHAGPGPDNVGLNALHAYHEGFLTGFLPAFSNPRIEFVQQISAGDRVVSQMLFQAEHTRPLFGHPASGKSVTLQSIRIDRFQNAKIAEHWSVADMAGFIQQLQR